MVITEATPDNLQFDAARRSHYGFWLLAEQATMIDNGERLVGRDELERIGCSIEPFWAVRGDLEGDEYQAYIANHPEFGLMVRQGVYERLMIVQEQLPDLWQLVLKAGFRPFDVQLRLLDVFRQKSRDEHPDRTEEQHLEHARMFVSDPRIVCPPHVTGGAVDVDVKDRETGEYIDMGCSPNTDSELSFLHSDQVTPEQYQNRMTLLGAMLAAGFAPNPYEWWHYQYGETYWAAFYGHATTLYSMVDER